MNSIDRQFSGYSPDELKAIVHAGGGLKPRASPQKLQERIEEHVHASKIREALQEWERLPAPVTEFIKLKNHAERVLILLGVAIDGKPSIRPRIRQPLMQQGFTWARRWDKSQSRAKRRAILRKAYVRRLPVEKAAAAKQSRQVREESWNNKIGRLHRLHGGWPDDQFLAPVNYPDGSIGIDVYGQELALERAVEGVQRLRTWAALAAKNPISDEQLKKLKAWKGRYKRKPITNLIGKLSETYSAFFCKDFGISKPSPKAARKAGSKSESVYGPGVRFIQACLEPLGVNMEGAAIEKAWDVWRADKAKNMGNRPRQ